MAAELEWEAIDLTRISKQAWNQVVTQAEKIKSLAEKVHNLRCRTGEFDLDAEYEDCTAEYVGLVAILRPAAPGYIAEFGNIVYAEARILEPQLRELWRRQDRAADFVTVSARYVRLLDQAAILGVTKPNDVH